MVGIDEMGAILDEIVDGLPSELFAKLNGGVGLIEGTKLNKKDPDGELYILGEYHCNQMGRYITLYYGSICAVHGHKRQEQLKECLRKLVCHELTHHIESLAGARDLEIKDELDLYGYFSSKNRRMSKLARRGKFIVR